MNPNALGRLEPANLGQCFVAVDPAHFPAGYSQRLRKLTDQLRGLPTAKDAPGPVLIPGDKERFRTEQQKADKVELFENIAQALDRLADKLHTPRPAWQ